MSNSDAFELERFLVAQAPMFQKACDELKAGQKKSHWIWFIFPQLVGLGHSATSQYFAIKSREEAIAYLKHPVLGPRLRECTSLVLKVRGKAAEDIFGYPDVLKFHSSMTLFNQVAGENSIYQSALEEYFGGDSDPSTLHLLETL